MLLDKPQQRIWYRNRLSSCLVWKSKVTELWSVLFHMFIGSAKVYFQVLISVRRNLLGPYAEHNPPVDDHWAMVFVDLLPHSLAF